MYRTASRLLLVLTLAFVFSQDASAQFTGCINIQQVTREACEVLEKLFHETNGVFLVQPTRLANGESALWLVRSHLRIDGVAAACDEDSSREQQRRRHLAG